MRLKCSIKECNRPLRCKELCSLHYQRKIKYGSPIPNLKLRRRFRPGERFIRNGYVIVAGNKSDEYVREHILIAEKALGKKLPENAVVHHADGNPLNNKNSNLVICPNNSYHRHLHRRLNAFNSCGNPDYIKCSYCGEYDDIKNLYISLGSRLGEYGIRKDLTARHKKCTKIYMKKYHENRIAGKP